MKILFVHGLGATRFDFLLSARRLKRLGHEIQYFSYFASLQRLHVIRRRLSDTLSKMASSGDYAVVGHSLGGVLLREALLALPPELRQPEHLFLLGSPLVATTVNVYLNRFALYKFLFGECGQLVASSEAMSAIGLPNVMTTCIAGAKGFYGRYSPFGTEPNDGLVLESELGTGRFADLVRIGARHPFLPASYELCGVIHGRLTSGG